MESSDKITGNRSHLEKASRNLIQQKLDARMYVHEEQAENILVEKEMFWVTKMLVFKIK